MHFSYVPRIISVLVVSISATSSGCAKMELSKMKMPWSDPARKLKKSDFQKPARIVALWTPTVLNAAGKPPTRGLGGRLYFYNEQSQAVPVQGQLVVYAYDDAAIKKKQPGTDEPDRKYAFTPEQFSEHYSPTDLGASYSVWIPWGGVDGATAELSLVPVFTSSEGQVVMGQVSRHVIPGKTTRKAEEETPSFEELPSPSDRTVKPVSYEEPLSRAAATRSRNLSSETISLSPSLVENLRHAQMNAGETAKADASKTSPREASSITAQPNESAANSTTTEPSDGVIPRPWTPPDPRSTRFERPIFQVPEALGRPPISSPAPLQRDPGGLPSDPEPILESSLPRVAPVGS